MKFRSTLAFLFPLLALSATNAHDCGGIKTYLGALAPAIGKCSQDSDGFITELQVYSSCLSVEQLNTVVKQERLKTLHFEAVTSSVQSTYSSLKSCKTVSAFPTVVSSLTKLETVVFKSQFEFRESDFKLLPSSVSSITFKGQKNAANIPYRGLCNLPKLYTLDLSENDLTVVPEQVSKLKQIKKLNICHNHIKVVPDFIGELVELQEVNFEYNEITTISNGFGKLKKITSVNFTSNKIEIIPDAFFKCTSLKKVIFEKNYLKKFPKGIPRLKYLTNLNLKNNQINDEIPSDYSSMSKLTEIDVELNVDIKGKGFNNPNLKKCNFGKSRKGNKYSMCGSQTEVKCGKTVHKDCSGGKKVDSKQSNKVDSKKNSKHNKHNDKKKDKHRRRSY